MANRYWVGNGGNINDTAHWSDVSGGTGGFSVPTSADDVYFDDLSFSLAGQDVLIPVSFSCNDIDCSDLAYLTNFKCSSVSTPINIYGNTKLSSNVFGYGSGIYLILKLCATTSKTLNINGAILSQVFIDGVGGSWTMQSDNNNIFEQWNIVNGSLHLNGYSLHCYRVYIDTVGVRGLYIDNGTLTMYNMFVGNYTGLTFDGGTGTVISRYFDLKGGTLTFYNLKAFDDLTAYEMGDFALYNGHFIVTNLFTVHGKDISNRRMNVYGAWDYQIDNVNYWATKITAANIDITNANFRDIETAGAADWDLSKEPTYCGDAGGNSGSLICSEPYDLYFYVSSGGTKNWHDPNYWYLGSGGTGGRGRVPLPQDNAIFDENSFVDFVTTTVYINQTWACKNLDASAVDTMVTFRNNVTLSVLGYIKYSTFVRHSVTGNTGYNIWARYGDVDIDLGGNTTYTSIYFYYPLNKYTILTGFTCQSFNARIIDLNDQYLKAGYCVIAGGVETSYLKTGTIEGHYFQFGTNIDFGTSLIYLNSVAGDSNRISFEDNSNVYNLQIGGVCVLYWITIYYNICYFNKITIEAGKKIGFYHQGITIVEEFIAEGTAPSNIYLDRNGVVGGSNQFTLYKIKEENITVNYCNITNSAAYGYHIKKHNSKSWLSEKKTVKLLKKYISKISQISTWWGWYASNSTDGGNNSGWIFN